MIQDQSKNEKPFFCWSAFYNPHQPYIPQKKYMDMYDVSKWGIAKLWGYYDEFIQDITATGKDEVVRQKLTEN